MVQKTQYSVCKEPGYQELIFMKGRLRFLSSDFPFFLTLVQNTLHCYMFVNTFLENANYMDMQRKRQELKNLKVFLTLHFYEHLKIHCKLNYRLNRFFSCIFFFFFVCFFLLFFLFCFWLNLFGCIFDLMYLLWLYF